MKKIVYDGDKISKLSLGTVQFGLDYGIANKDGQPTQNDVNKIIQYVYDNGINCFDTAQAYGNSEEILGVAIKNKNSIFVISKLKSDLFLHNLEMNIANSLNNLNSNCLYGLLLHDSELLYNWKREYSLLIDKLIIQNKIKYFGVSIYSNEDFELALNNDYINFIQIPFNIFDQRAIYLHWLKKAKAKNKLIFIRSIFLQGLLLMDIDKVPNHLANAKKYLLNLNKYCEELNVTKNEMALNFVDTVAKESIILFGCDNLIQAKDNITTYNNLQSFDNNIIANIVTDFQDVSEDIYNPIRWTDG